MKTHLFILMFIFLSFDAYAQNDSISFIRQYRHTGFLQSDFMAAGMPDGEKKLGLSGLHYIFDINRSFYGGVGYYGAITGRRGGFFTLGLNAGFQARIQSKLFVDAGIYFGGGGGAAAPDGGGAVILPHAHIGYRFSHVSLLAGYNYLNFFDGGRIKSHQLSYALRIPLQLRHTSVIHTGKTIRYEDYAGSEWDVPERKIDFTLRLNRLLPKKKSREFVSGASLAGKKIQLLGFELAANLDKNDFLFTRADGGYKGIKGGYLNVLFGYGHKFSIFNDRTQIALKFAAGPGGGGDVDTKGGLLLAPDLSVTQKIWKNFSVNINKGYLLTPDQHFFGTTLGLGLQYHLHQSGFRYNENQHYRSAVFKGLEITAGQEVYFNAKRTDISPAHLHQFFTQLNFSIHKPFYAAIDVSFANFGNAGAYGEGSFGIGMSTAKDKSFSGFIQVMAGGSGGGGLDVGQGLIIKPAAGLQYHVHPVLSLRSTVGFVKAMDGRLSSPTFSLGLNYSISLLHGRR